MSGRISNGDIDRVRDATDLVALAGERMALRRVGRRHTGLCPFHDEKTPSFSIDGESGLFYCFGCAASGNAFQFLMHLDNLTFTDAVEALARRTGITVHFEDESPNEARQRERKPRLLAAVDASVGFYRDRLFRDEGASGARAYLASRGYGRDVARRFDLGWAPAAWDALVHHLKRCGYLEQEMVDAGVATRGTRTSAIDLLRDRLVFPIQDAQGQPIAVAGRALSDDVKPKYLNSPETPLYRKSRTLYGLDRAKSAIVARGEALVVEGYTDVIGLHMAEATQAVATCGTALGEEHLRLLKRYATRVVLAFDGDTAGAAATERTFAVASDLGLDMRVAILPEGRDPAEVAAEGTDAVAAVLARQRPLLEFKVERELERASFDSAEGEARAAASVAAAIAVHPDGSVRGGVARRYAHRFREITEAELVGRVETARRDGAESTVETRGAGGESAGRRGAGGGTPGSNAGVTAGPGGRAPGSPRRLPRVDEAALVAVVQAPRAFLAAVPQVSAEWFATERARPVAGLLLAAARAAPEGGGCVDVEAIEVSDGLRPSLRRLAVIDPPGFTDMGAYARDAAAALERAWLGRRIGELQRSLQRAESEDDARSVLSLDAQLVAFIERRQALGET